MKICFHQFSDDIDIVVAGTSFWFDQVNQLDDVFMLEEFEKFDLSKDTFGIDEVFECILDLRLAGRTATFLIAILVLRTVSYPEQTTPYAPWPICLMHS